MKLLLCLLKFESYSRLKIKIIPIKAMPIKNIIFDLEGVLGFYLSPNQFDFYPKSLECINTFINDYNLFYLTNVLDSSGEYFNQSLSKDLDKMGFVGGLGSNNYPYKKPDFRFYKQLLSQYNLVAGECLFIDDKIANVLAAKDLGIQSIVHTGNGENLIEQIQESTKPKSPK